MKLGLDKIAHLITFDFDFRIRRLLKMAIDLSLIALAYYVSFWLRFDGHIDPRYQQLLFSSLPIVLVVYFLVMMCFSIYKGMWKYSSVRDLAAIILSNTIGLVMIVPLLWVFLKMPAPRSSLLIFWLLNVIALGGVRLYYTLSTIYWPNFNRPMKRTLIVGAGSSGERIVRQMFSNHHFGYKPVGFVDDAKGLRGDRIHQIPVMGTLTEMAKIIQEKKIHEIIIAIPTATAQQMRRIVQLCQGTGLPFFTLPAAKELINDRISLDSIRPVKIEDLLERSPKVNHADFFREHFAGKRVLVTGAAGSIGGELCSQLAKMDLDSLIMLDRAESDLFDLENHIRKSHNPRITLVSLINDVTRYRKLERDFLHYQPHIVFHAAAYKHVPLMERFPQHAVINNLGGTIHVSRAARVAGCERVVMISTDKAVNPSSIMGASKRAAELYCALQAKEHPKHVVVRFGNVMASKGSVIPLFEQQIRAGGPVTVTSKEIERFFMTIPEAVELVLQAGSIGNGGETFVLDMGAPIKIYDLARHLIALSGFEPDVDIPIEITGLREGEKLYEELWSADEKSEVTPLPKIIRVTSEFPCNRRFFLASVNRLLHAAERADQNQIRQLFMDIIPNAQLLQTFEKTLLCEHV